MIKINEKERILEIENIKIDVIENEKIRMDNVNLGDLHNKYKLNDSEINKFFEGNNYNEINLGLFEKILFKGCEIRFDNSLETRVQVFFEDCLFDGNIKIRQNGEITFKGEANSFISISNNGENISLKNSNIVLKLISGIFKMHPVRNEQVNFNCNSSEIYRIFGKIEEFHIPNINFNFKHSKCLINLFTNNENLEFTELKLNNDSDFKKDGSCLIMHSINFKKISISNLELELDIKNLDLYNSDILFIGNASLYIGADILKSVATVWNPSKINYRGFCPGEKINKKLRINNVLAAQEFFSEMKEYFSNRGNGIVASSFYAAEMKAHRAYLIKKYWPFNRDRLIASWSYYSSDFNQDWVRPLLWYFLMSLIFVIIFAIPNCIEYGDIINFNVLSDFKNNFSSTLLYVNYYSDILNPLTISFKDFKNDNLGLVDMPNFLVFLWMIWKIIAGYLIYQIVVSSRRFMRFS